MTFLRIIIGVCFLSAGTSKLLGSPFYIRQFSEFGLSRKFLLVIGLFETVAGLGFLLDRYVVFCACFLMIVMAGAIAVHIKAGHNFTRWAPAVFFAVLLTVLLMGHLV